MRIFVIADAFSKGYTVNQLFELTRIDPWFLYKLQNVYNLKNELESFDSLEDISFDLLKSAKMLGPQSGCMISQITCSFSANATLCAHSAG